MLRSIPNGLPAYRQLILNRCFEDLPKWLEIVMS